MLIIDEDYLLSESDPIVRTMTINADIDRPFWAYVFFHGLIEVSLYFLNNLPIKLQTSSCKLGEKKF